MKSWFFYQERGRTIGPLTSSDMHARIRDGRLRPFDLVYKEGDRGWCMALECPELKEAFADIESTGSPARPWVCLQKKTKSGLNFVTTGPFSEEEVKRALMEGKLTYGDYAWREGLQEWRRLGTLVEFNPRLQEEGGTSSTPTDKISGIQAEELLKNVVEIKRPRVTAGSPPPQEAEGEDLTKISGIGADYPTVVMDNPLMDDADDPPTEPSIRISDYDPETRTAASWDEDKTRIVEMGDSETEFGALSEANTVTDARFGGATDPDADPDAVTRIVPELQAKTSTSVPTPSATPTSISTSSLESEPASETEDSDPWSRHWVDWGIVAALMVAFIGGVVWISRIVRAPKPGPVAESPLPTPPQPSDVQDEPALTVKSEEKVPAAEEAQTETAPAPPPPPPPRPVRKEPTELYLKLHAAGSRQARIEIRTDGSPHFPVYVQVVGLPGQVAEGASFYWYKRLAPSGDPDEPLDLSELKLPQGRFIVRATTGELHKEERLNLGIGEASYKQETAQQRKIHASAIWEERLQLMRLATALEAEIASSIKSKRFSTKPFRALQAVNKSNGGRYVLFESWYELKEIFTEARKGADEQLLIRAKRAREQMARFSVWR
ncbi:MAG: DUF4339 domain-containing protein [Bdellovibrionales bacterium]